jgi:hypothetical protein
VKYGLKPLKNDEAQKQYIQEVQKVVRDLNVRYVRARLPQSSAEDAAALIDRLLRDRESEQGISYGDLLKLPHAEFFRRRGVPAFTMVGVEGERFSSLDEYRRHLVEHLPDAYRAGEDFRDYLDALEKVVGGQLSLKEAVGRMPALRRVAGACPCSKAVRWVADLPATAAQANPAPAR